MNTFDTDSILAGLEAYIDELPPARRRRRTKEEIYNPDLSPESENYDKPSLWDALTAGAGRRAADDPAQALVLAWEIKGRIALLCRSSHRMQGDKDLHSALTQLVTMAGGDESEEVQDRALAIFHTLEWERQQPIIFGTTGLLFKTEADWEQYKAARGGAK